MGRRPISLGMTIATPRATSRITAFSTAGLLALGSQRPATFPVSQWCLGLQLTDYSFGGSRGFGAPCLCRLSPLTAFPFNPLAGNRHPIDKGKDQPPSIEFAGHERLPATSSDLCPRRS